jgi:hypothetical protein
VVSGGDAENKPCRGATARYLSFPLPLSLSFDFPFP